MPRRLLLLVPLLASCAFLGDRASDLGDLLTVEASTGVGVAADVKATELAHVGVGYAQVRKFGRRGRTIERSWDREVGLPASLLLTAGALSEGNVWRTGHLYANHSELWYGEADRRLADIEGGVFAGIIGLRIGVSPAEFLDFVAGFAGFDPSGDDAAPRPAPLDGPVEPGVWLAGDLHDHCDPPDGGHAPVTPEQTRALAAANGLDFVGIDPHLWVRGIAPAEREDLAALAARIRAMEGTGGPIVLPGFEVMVLRRWWGSDRRTAPFLARGHALLLFRDLDDAYDFAGPFADEAEWVRDRLARLPPERRLWAPTHPWPHPRLRIPFFPDRGAAWRQIEEESTGATTLGGRGNERLVTPWRATTHRGEGETLDRLVRYRLPPAGRDGLVAWPAGGGEATAANPEPAVLAETLRSALGGGADAEPERRWAATTLAEAIRRERARAPEGEGPWRLTVAVDAGRNAWISAVVRGPGSPGPVALAWGATRLGPDGRALPPLHDVPIDGAECLTGLLHVASLAVGRRGDELDRERLLPLLARRMLAERRRIAPLGGSDNHNDLLLPTMWVFARERSRAAIFDAIRSGRVCLGGPEARSLRVRTDRDPVWRAVGADPAADRRVELRWDGEAEIFVDGESRGRRRNGFVHELDAPGSPHVYRIAKGRSRSGFVTVNLARSSSRDPFGR